MNRKMYKARVTTSFALAHLAKEVVDKDWPAATAAFRLRVLVGENVGVLHRMRARLRRVAARRQDEPIRRALAILDVAVGKPNEVMHSESGTADRGVAGEETGVGDLVRSQGVRRSAQTNEPS